MSELPPPLPPKPRHPLPLPDRPPVPSRQYYQSSGDITSSSTPPPPLPPRSRPQEPISDSLAPQLPPRPYYYHKKRDGSLKSSFRRSGAEPQAGVLEESRLDDVPDLPPPLPPSLPPRKDTELVFGTKRVKGLTFKSFGEFIADKEKTLVMFYDSTDNSDPAIAGEFGIAAGSSQNKKYAFGAVDCAADPSVCCSEKVSNTPILKLYSNGFEVSAIRSLQNFTSQQMMMLVAMSPVLTQPRV